MLKDGNHSRRLVSAPPPPPPAHIRTRPIRRLTRQPSAVPTLAARATRPAASLGFAVTHVEKLPTICWLGVAKPAAIAASAFSSSSFLNKIMLNAAGTTRFDS